MALEELYVIIPAYNEGQSIRKVIDQFHGTGAKVVVVDDGSKDNTTDVLKGSSAIVLEHLFNLGQGAALQTGITFAAEQADCLYIATFDADGQHRLDDLIKMYETIKNNKALDIVLGSRFLGSRNETMPTMRKVLLRAGTKVMNSLSDTRLTDTHNGLRVMTKEFAKKLNIISPDMAHASEILIKIAKYNARYSEVPIEVVYTNYSKSKGQPMINSVNIIVDVIVSKYLEKA